MYAEDIPSLPNREQRFRELLVDCYGQSEELAAMEVYFTDAVHYPFQAEWRDPDEGGHTEPVTVLGMTNVDERRGVLLNLRRTKGKARRTPAEQVWAKERQSANAIVLDDYRYWVNEMDGLTPGYE